VPAHIITFEGQHLRSHREVAQGITRRENKRAELRAKLEKRHAHKEAASTPYPIDRTALEHEVIILWSRAMTAEILKAIRLGKTQFMLIPQGQKQNGKAAPVSQRRAKRSIGSFADLAQALRERSDRASAEV
jgi:hypothetical protein